MIAPYSESMYSKPRNTPPTTPSKRRMFPLRRTPLSALNSLNTNSSSNISPLERHLSHELAGENYHDHFSDDGSSGSSGTVKISALSGLELPNTDLGWDNHADVQCLLQTPQSPSDHHGIAEASKLPSTPASASRAFPYDRNETASTPPHYGTRALRRKVRWNSRAEVCNTGRYLGLEGCRSLPDLRTAVHEGGLIAPTKVVNHTPLNDTVHKIDAWDTSVKLCTAITMSQKGEIEVHHHAQLTVTIPKQDISATRVKLRLQISNGVQTDHTCDLDSGKSSIYFEYGKSSSSSEDQDTDINIIRDTADAEESLNIYLLHTFPVADQCPVVLLPTFRPSKGTILSESVFVADSAPPLILKTMLRNDFSTWILNRNTFTHATCLKREKMPPLYPVGLQDDVRIKVTLPSPVRFRSIGNLSAADVVWDLQIKVEKKSGLRLKCYMSLWLEVGVANTLLAMDSHGWIASYFLVDNRPATEAGGEWRIDEGRMILFKQNNQLLGPIKIEMNWEEPTNEDQSNDEGVNQLLLPRIVDREVLGASFMGENSGVVTFNNPGIKDDTFLCEEGSPTRLPTLHKGYSMHLKPKHSTPQLDEDVGNRCNAAILVSHPPIRHLILQVSIAFILILSLFVGLHSNRLHNYDMILRECILPTPNELNSFGQLEFSEHSAKQSADATYQDDISSGEEGWRDWVDTSLGWKGYTS